MFLEHSWGLTKPNTVKNNQFFVTLYNAGGEKGEFWLQLFPLDKPGETGCEKKKKKKSKEEDKKIDEDQYVRWGSSATRQGNGDVAKDQKTSARKNSSAVTAGEARNHGHVQIPSAWMMTRVCAAACPPSH